MESDNQPTYGFDAELWRWTARDGSWQFLTVPEDVSDDIEASSQGSAGFGSVKIEVTIGDTTWQTSVFPDSKQGAYVLPVKKAVRAAEDLDVGTIAKVEIRTI